jgi:hypothetical protein
LLPQERRDVRSCQWRRPMNAEIWVAVVIVGIVLLGAMVVFVVT